MLDKQFVTYEIALALKELGFNNHCLAFYSNNEELHIYNNCKEHYQSLKAPLWQQVIDWLMRKYNIYINVLPITFDTEPTFIFEIISLKNGELLNDVDSSFLDVNEAREQAILKAIELCQKEK